MGRLDFFPRYGYTEICGEKDKKKGNRWMEIPKKIWVIVGAVLAAIAVVIIVVAITSNGDPVEESKEEINFPSVKELLSEPNADNALVMQQLMNASDAAEQKNIAKEVRQWIESSLSQYKEKQLSQEETKKRIQFIQSCGVLDADEVLGWVREKNTLDALLRAESLYNEAMEWFNEENYRLAKESAAMISQDVPEYYEMATELIRQCEEKEAEAIRLAEEAKKQEYMNALADICQRYEMMNVGTVNECDDLLDEYQEVLGKIQEMSIGNQLMQEAKNQYPLPEWKVECKRLIFENLASGSWSEKAGIVFVENHSTVPFMVVQDEALSQVYRWSSIHHQWQLYQPGQDAVYVGMDVQSLGFLYANLKANEETYYWLELTEDGWVQQDKLEKTIEEVIFLWVIKTQRPAFYQNGEAINMMQYHSLVQNYVQKCENSKLPQVDAQSLEEALAKY